MGDLSATQIPLQPSAPPVSMRPLCVDLDGTLVKSDTLWDSLMLLARTQPLALLQVPRWLARGKAALKAEVGKRVSLDVRSLPYNRKLLTFLESERNSGRRVYLATGADQVLAARISDHLGLFDGVLASDGRTNLTASNKLESLREAFGDDGYDYVGNSGADLPLLVHASSAMIANPAPRLRSRLRSLGVPVAHDFEERSPWPTTIRRTLRLHQWAKNILIFLPVLLAHNLQLPVLLTAVLAFLSFSFCASATYIINDLLDIEADRHHPRKQRRPFAAGDLSVRSGMIISAVLLAGAFLLATLALTQGFLFWLLIYLVT